MSKERFITIQTRLLPPKFRIRLGDQTPASPVRMRQPNNVLCSYPKSGNTWLRFLLANLIRPGGVKSGPDVQKIVPDIYKMKAKALEEAAPVIFKSHESLRPDYQRVIYLYRDPRDVAVSYFHYGKATGALDRNLSLEDYAASFVAHEPQSGHSFGNWGEHVRGWYAAKEHAPDFLPVAYEAMLEDPARELKRIAGFLDLPTHPDAIAVAIRQSSAGEMRRIEEKGRFGPKPRKRKFASDARFVRKAKAETWREELPPVAARRIEDAFGPSMEKLGYL